jgi:hypothetical protein
MVDILCTRKNEHEDRIESYLYLGADTHLDEK